MEKAMIIPELNASLLLKTWSRVRGFPGGKRIFSHLIRLAVPYSGTTGVIVESLERGRVKISLPDKRRVRNHLKSIHAMAMANFGELSTGLALNTALPETARAILTSFTIDYVKKGRGTLTAESHVEVMERVTEKRAMEVRATIRNDQNEEIAHIRAEWLVAPRIRVSGHA